MNFLLVWLIWNRLYRCFYCLRVIDGLRSISSNLTMPFGDLLGSRPIENRFLILFKHCFCIYGHFCGGSRFICIDHIVSIIIIMLSQFNKFGLVDIFRWLCRTYSYLWVIIFGPPGALLTTLHVKALVGRHVVLTLFWRLCVELLFELAILVSEGTWSF